MSIYGFLKVLHAAMAFLVCLPTMESEGHTYFEEAPFGRVIEIHTFDKIFSVNSMMFWPEPVETLKALRRMLKPGGLIAMTVQPRYAPSPSAWRWPSSRSSKKRLAPESPMSRRLSMISRAASSSSTCSLMNHCSSVWSA